MLAPQAFHRLRPHPGACAAALAGLLALAAGPAPAADQMVLNAQGEMQDSATHPATPVSEPAMPAGHPGTMSHPMPVSASPTAPPMTSAVNLATSMPAPEGTMEGGAMGEPTASPYLYQARGLRDPFSLPAEVRAPTSDEESIPPLERHALADFRLVAVVQGSKGAFAMVTTTEGKGYTVRVGTRIGPDGGRVRQISKNSVIVEVVKPDEFGELKKSETVMALRPEEVVP